MRKETLGVDIGGVIIDRANDGEDTSFFGDNYLEAFAVSGVFEALRDLTQHRFDGRVVLISKCGEKIQEKTWNWLDCHRFFSKTGIPRDHVHFCRHRSEKAGICEELDVTHFVDDRLDVLASMSLVSTKYLFSPHPNDLIQFTHFLAQVHIVHSWREIIARELP